METGCWFKVNETFRIICCNCPWQSRVWNEDTIPLTRSLFIYLQISSGLNQRRRTMHGALVICPKQSAARINANRAIDSQSTYKFTFFGVARRGNRDKWCWKGFCKGRKCMRRYFVPSRNCRCIEPRPRFDGTQNSCGDIWVKGATSSKRTDCFQRGISAISRDRSYRGSLTRAG